MTRRSALLLRSFRRPPGVAVRGEGGFLIGQDGQRYLDFSGSAAVNFIGHGDPEIAEAIGSQLLQLEFAHTSQFVTSAAEEFARELLAFAGEPFRGGAVFFTSGGSEAVETALKLARQYQVESGHPERSQIISREQSYHGSTLGALSVSGNRARRAMYLPMVRDSAKIYTPYCYRCPYDCVDCARQYASELEQAISQSQGSAAAFICEPVSGATLGAAVPPGSYLGKIRDICSQQGLLFIADEVMTGCGRTGRNFAFEHWEASPDILVTAKGLASGYAPLGAVIASARVADAIADGSGTLVHGFTFNAHPLAVAAGRAVLRKLRVLDLVRQADSRRPGSIGDFLREELGTLRDCPTVGDVRGLGMLWGVEFVADRETRQPFPRDRSFASRVGEACRKRGVLVYPMQGCVDGCDGDHLLIAPPAIISRAQVKDAVSRLREAIIEVEPSVRV